MYLLSIEKRLSAERALMYKPHHSLVSVTTLYEPLYEGGDPYREIKMYQNLERGSSPSPRKTPIHATVMP